MVKPVKKNTNILTRVIPSLSVLACGGEAVLTEISPRFRWADGVETDQLAGWEYKARLVRNGYEVIALRTDELAPAMDPDDLDKLIESGETILVTDAPGFSIQLFATKKGTVSVSARVDTVTLDVKGAAK